MRAAQLISAHAGSVGSSTVGLDALQLVARNALRASVLRASAWQSRLRVAIAFKSRLRRVASRLRRTG